MAALTEAELKIMEILWDSAPKTLMELTHLMAQTTGWTKQTIITSVSYTHLDVYKRQSRARAFLRPLRAARSFQTKRRRSISERACSGRAHPYR